MTPIPDIIVYIFKFFGNKKLISEKPERTVGDVGNFGVGGVSDILGIISREKSIVVFGIPPCISLGWNHCSPPRVHCTSPPLEPPTSASKKTFIHIFLLGNNIRNKYLQNLLRLSWALAFRCRNKFITFQ